MDLSLIKSFFSLITNNIFFIIYFFAAVEIYLIFSIFLSVRKHESVLLDVSDNLLKGFPDAPDKDSTQHIHEKIQTALEYITNKISSDSSFKKKFGANAEKIGQRSFYNRHYKIEIYASVMATLVQVFPLLGILGTILAIAQTAMQPGSEIDVASLSNAFVLAMDTTILGITFSILFMIIESTFQAKIERVIFESNEYRKIISSIYLA
jgi:biopolymer transport protein ExbB/TolQ